MEEEDQCIFLTLPIELKQKILSYLDYYDLLSIRSTCKPLQTLLRDWKYFQDITEFTLKDPTTIGINDHNVDDSLSILNPESLQFSNLCLWGLEEKHLRRTPGNKILAYKNIQHLCLRRMTFSWIDFQKFISNFPNLNSLKFQNCSLNHGTLEGWTQKAYDLRKFEIFCQNKLRKLDFVVQHFSELDFYFTKFSNVPILQSISVHYRTLATNDEENESLDCPIQLIKRKFLKLLCSNYRELVKIEITASNTEALKPFADEDESDYENEFINYPDLELPALETLHISQPYEPTRKIQIKFQNSIYDYIIRGANKLKYLTLPWHIQFSDDDDTYLMRTLPKSLEGLSVNISHHILRRSQEESSAEFYNSFPQLTTLILNLFFEETIWCLRGETLPKIKTLVIGYCLSYDDGVPNMFNNIKDVFTSLSTLKILHCSSNNLQEIISSLNTLKVLDIDNRHTTTTHTPIAASINDFGVTGIELSYCERLKNDNAVENELALEEGARQGAPLGNLRDLKEFYLRCSQISDVGVFYGMQFGPNIEKITIGCNSMSSEGAFLLAKLNPTLSILTLQLGGEIDMQTLEERIHESYSHMIVNIRKVCGQGRI